MKVSLLPLNELYARPKITAAVEAAIQAKEDFSRIAPNYCEKVCKLKCKAPQRVQLLNQEVDILIVQDHMAPRGKFDRTDDGQEQIQRSIIDFICRQAGFNGLRYRLTTLLKCKPNDQDFPKGKPPTITVLQKCKPYLLAEIERCKPKVIISLSTAVTKALGLKKHSNTGNRGEIVGNVVITLHPRVLTMIRQNSSGSMWGADYFRVIVRDFNKAARMARGQLAIPDLQEAIEFYARNRIAFARSLQDVKAIVDTINALPERAIISFDTETTGLDPWAPDAKLLTIQFGWRDPKTGNILAAVIPLWHRENTFFDADEAWQMVAPLLLSNRPKVGHNSKFDILYIAVTTGVRVRNVAFDTLLILHSIDSGAQGTYGLKTATWDWLADMGIGGYEDLLPKLTKVKEVDEEENEDTNTEEAQIEYA
jgi:DNA polymerase I - 3''-5'' exonuclease and polymerase domains